MNQPTAPCRPPRIAANRKPRDSGEEDEAEDSSEQPVRPFPEEDELESRQRHAGRSGDFAILRCPLVEREFVHPLSMGQRRDGADDRLPLRDRQAAFGETRDAADDDHAEDERRDEE